MSFFLFVVVFINFKSVKNIMKLLKSSFHIHKFLYKHDITLQENQGQQRS